MMVAKSALGSVSLPTFNQSQLYRGARPSYWGIFTINVALCFMETMKWDFHNKLTLVNHCHDFSPIPDWEKNMKFFHG